MTKSDEGGHLTASTSVHRCMYSHTICTTHTHTHKTDIHTEKETDKCIQRGGKRKQHRQTDTHTEGKRREWEDRHRE